MVGKVCSRGLASRHGKKKGPDLSSWLCWRPPGGERGARHGARRVRPPQPSAGSLAAPPPHPKPLPCPDRFTEAKKKEEERGRGGPRCVGRVLPARWAAGGHQKKAIDPRGAPPPPRPSITPTCPPPEELQQRSLQKGLRLQKTPWRLGPRHYKVDTPPLDRRCSPG
ncbi:hypothetical protein I4F81_000049 [Pyropia yezoensis]|uniref:Uncharacterized protein n=1 Tax=Pyropia yezoensis TaxID=2788 RepID=A0ACC3BHT6_PYRYE|nr:hypothetical protein I4F81_000049 [Neopyropia yezoensis]